jgi:hypothetical protein
LCVHEPKHDDYNNHDNEKQDYTFSIPHRLQFILGQKLKASSSANLGPPVQ